MTATDVAAENVQPIIVARDLKKIYRADAARIRALNGVDVSIMPGEHCAILGTSGSGKSTLLSILAGLEHPTSGKVFIMRHPIHAMNEKELVDFRLHNIGFVFQSFNLMPTMTAVENVALPLMFQGVPKAIRETKAARLLTRMGLEKQLRSRPSQMSGGQQQRVSIARALISRPEIIFADEPTGNLDSATSAQIMDLMTEVADQRGATLIFVTHDEEHARYADKVLHIRDGQVDRTETHPRNVQRPSVPPEAASSAPHHPREEKSCDES